MYALLHELSYFCHIFMYLFYWNIIALQCSISFNCTTSWISHMDISPSLLSLLSPIHLGYSQGSELSSLCYTTASCQLFYIWWGAYVSATLSICIPLLPLLCPRVLHTLHLHLYSWPANRFNRAIFWIPYIYVNKQCLFFSFWLTQQSHY